MLRYHSFYAAHRHGAYRHLVNEPDERMFEWVRKFNLYALYAPKHKTFFLTTKSSSQNYQELVSDFSLTKSPGDWLMARPHIQGRVAQSRGFPLADLFAGLATWQQPH